MSIPRGGAYSELQRKIKNYIEGYVIVYIYTVLELGLQWATQETLRL